MRMFTSKQDWLKNVNRPWLIIVVTGLRAIILDNDLYERSSE